MCECEGCQCVLGMSVCAGEGCECVLGKGSECGEIVRGGICVDVRGRREGCVWKWRI